MAEVYADPTKNYLISNMDEGGTTKYYGYLDKFGRWFIMQWNTTLDTFRYITGESEYLSNWGKRGILDYKLFNEAFG
jgi:hypothetical protein